MRILKFYLFSRRAFTLLEITISLLVLTIGLVGILALFPIGFKAVAEACNYTKATIIAQTVMEDVKKARYEGASSYNNSYESPYSKFGYTVTVSGVGGLALKKIDVEVSWPVGAVNQKNVSLSTYIADYEP